MILKENKTNFALVLSFLLDWKNTINAARTSTLPYDRVYSMNRVNQEFGRRFQTKGLKTRERTQHLWLESEDETFFRELESMSMSMSMSMSFSYVFEFQSTSTNTNMNPRKTIVSSSPSSSPSAKMQSLSPSSKASRLTPTSFDSLIPSVSPSSATSLTPSLAPSSLSSANPSAPLTLAPSASVSSVAPSVIRMCESTNMTEESSSNLTVEEISFKYSSETVNDSIDFISIVEEKMLEFVADNILDCDPRVRARRMMTPTKKRRLSLQQIDSRPTDTVSQDETCVPSIDSNSCLVVDAYMTMTTEVGQEEVIRLQTLTAIRDAMKNNVFLSPSLPEVIALSYLGPNITVDQELKPQTRINSVGTPEDTNDVSSSNVVYAALGIIPLIVGFSAYLSVRKRGTRRTVPGRKKGYAFHEEEDHTDSDVNASSIVSEETEGEFVGVSPLYDHQKINIVNELDPPPPTDSQLSPSTQATYRVKNTSKKSKKSLFEI